MFSSIFLTPLAAVQQCLLLIFLSLTSSITIFLYRMFPFLFRLPHLKKQEGAGGTDLTMVNNERFFESPALTKQGIPFFELC